MVLFFYNLFLIDSFDGGILDIVLPPIMGRELDTSL